jgi:hypothetical protein
MKVHITKKCCGWSKSKGTSISSKSQLPDFFSNQHSITLTQDVVTEQVLKLFISGNIPFNQVENPEFKKLIHYIQLTNGNHAQTPSRKVLRDRLRKHHRVSKDELKVRFNTLDSKISLALDAWSTRNMQAFLGSFL